MQKSLFDNTESYPRHFMDSFDGFTVDENKLHCSKDVNKLKRRPKCKTRNKYTNESFAQIRDDSCYKATLFALPESAVIVPSLTDGCMASNYTDKRELVSVPTGEIINAEVQRSDSLSVFDVLCGSLQCSEVKSHQATTLSRWLSRHSTHTASSSLIQILMESKCPVVSFVSCRILKQLHPIPSVASCKFRLSVRSSLAVVDVISHVLFLQKEMVKFLETGQFSMKLLNVICLLDCITSTSCDILTRCNIYSRCCSRWSSSELRWAVLTVISLTNVIGTKVNSPLTISRRNDADLRYDARSVIVLVERVSQILNVMLTTSVQCEIAQTSNIFQILNEYWHTTNFYQRQRIVESVLVPKLRMEMCIRILAGHCDVSLRKRFASSLLLADILSIFDENVVISAIAQQVWMENDSLSVVGHCQEICLILCNAVCSYLLHQKGELKRL